MIIIQIENAIKNDCKGTLKKYFQYFISLFYFMFIV